MIRRRVVVCVSIGLAAVLSVALARGPGPEPHWRFLDGHWPVAKERSEFGWAMRGWPGSCNRGCDSDGPPGLSMVSEYSFAGDYSKVLQDAESEASQKAGSLVIGPSFIDPKMEWVVHVYPGGYDPAKRQTTSTPGFVHVTVVRLVREGITAYITRLPNFLRR